MNKQKKTLMICLVAFIVSIIFAFGYLMTHRSTKRMPTAEETAAAQIYLQDLNAATGQEGSVKEIVLSMCTRGEDQHVHSSTFQTYTSAELDKYLYQCEELGSILMDETGLLTISYKALDNNEVYLVYDDEGMHELGVYFGATDTFYFESDDRVELWEKFRGGVQFGK